MKCQIPSLLFSVRQPSVYMHVWIHQSGATSLASFFLHSLLFIPLLCQVLTGIGLIYLFCAAYQWIVVTTKWTQRTQKRAHSVIKCVVCSQLCFVSHLHGIHRIQYWVCKHFCMINESPWKCWTIICFCEAKGGKKWHKLQDDKNNNCSNENKAWGHWQVSLTFLSLIPAQTLLWLAVFFKH